MKVLSSLTLILLLLVVWSLSVDNAQGLTVTRGAAITHDGGTFSGTRTINPGDNTIVSESWTPFKPSTRWTFKISVIATGYGEATLALFDRSTSTDIGDWRSGPALNAANNAEVSFSVETLSPAYNFGSWSLPTENLPVMNEGKANEINTGTFTRRARGSVTVRSRNISRYGGTMVGMNLGLTMTGPSTGVVIGTNRNWVWSPGVAHPTQQASTSGTLSVSVTDSYSGSDSGNNGGNGAGGSDTTPSASASSNSGCANNPIYNWCTDRGSCTTRSPSGVPGECGHNFCCCAPRGSPMYSDDTSDDSDDDDTSDDSDDDDTSDDSDDDDTSDDNDWRTRSRICRRCSTSFTYYTQGSCSAWGRTYPSHWGIND